MSWLPAAIASFTAAGAPLGAAPSPLGRIFACGPAVSGSGPPAAVAQPALRLAAAAGWAGALGVISPSRLPVPGLGAGVTVTWRTPQASWAARPCQS